MWSLRNVLAGAASVQMFAPRSDYRQILDQVQARAEAESVATDRVLRQYVRERLFGQIAMTCVSLSAIALAVVGTANNWPDWIILPFALTPMTLMAVVGRLHQRALQDSTQ